jgi:hypothetical protein
VSNTWTSAQDVAARVRRRWDDGTLLRAYGQGEDFPPIEVPIRGPKPSQIGDDLYAVRDWIAALEAGSRNDTRYALQFRQVGGRAIGHNEIPSRAVVSTFEQAWAILNVTSSVQAFGEMLSLARGDAAVRTWILRNPHRALELRGELPQLIAAYRWLEQKRGSRLYLRQIMAPGVDTKFAERHRATLAAMLGVGSSAASFTNDLGLRSKPAFVRLRVSPDLGLPYPLREIAVPTQDLTRLDLHPRNALVIENEITFLSVDVPPQGVVIWGKGFDVDQVGRLPWLSEADVAYWGDIDTHGFAILDRLRAWLPRANSVMMDRETLLAHRDRWGREERPTSADLTRLTASERDLYTDLVKDRLGPQLRLEQERIDWAWATQRLPHALALE